MSMRPDTLHQDARTPLPRSEAEQEYERLTLAYWLARVPGLDDVTVTVRAGGGVVRFECFTPPVTSPPTCGGGGRPSSSGGGA